jgi:hypothetical protein
MAYRFHVTGDSHPGSRLWAKLVKLPAIIVIDYSFELSMLRDGRFLSWKWLWANRLFAGVYHPRSRLRAKQDMWRVFIVPDHGFTPTGSTCRLCWHTRLRAEQDMWWVFIVPDHGFMPTGSTCRICWHTRLWAKQVKWRVMFISDHSFEPSRLNGGWLSALIKASSKACYITGDIHTRSKLRAIHVMWWDIFSPDHGFEPAGHVMGDHHLKSQLYAYKLMCDHWRDTRLWAIHVMWQTVKVMAFMPTGFCVIGLIIRRHVPRGWLEREIGCALKGNNSHILTDEAGLSVFRTDDAE